MIYARQSTAIIVTVGPVLDSAGVAVTDGVVGDFKISKNGGNPGALNGSATLTHRFTGQYSLSLTTSDVDTVGTAEICLDDTTNTAGVKEIQVIEPAVYDAFYANAATGAVPIAPGGLNLASISPDVYPLFGIIDYGIAQSATSTTVVLRAATVFPNDILRGATIMLYGSDQSYWQERLITGNVLSTDTVTVDAWTVTPSDNLFYYIFATAPESATNPPNVNVVKINSVSTSAVLGVKAYVGTDQPVNFTGTAGTAYVQVDVLDINSLGTPAADGLGQIGNTYTNDAYVVCNLQYIRDTAVTESVAGRLAGGFKKWFDVASPTGTLNSLPDAVPGAANAVLRAGTNTATSINDLTLNGSVTVPAAVNITGAITAANASNNIVLGSTERTAIVAALAASIIKGTYTFADLEKDLAAMIGGIITGSGLTYAVPSTGWGANNTSAAVSGTGGDRTITRS